LSRTEGIVPAIESAHALAGALKLGPRLPTTESGEPPLILVNLSGRGDKDVDTAITWFGLDTAGTSSESPPAQTGPAQTGPAQTGGAQTDTAQTDTAPGSTGPKR
jgi:hypothetical protein